MRFEFSAGLLIHKRGPEGPLFLFLRREDGFLDIPKGHIEKGENAREAAIRETLEEAGIREENTDPFYRYDYRIWFLYRGEKIKKKISVFLAETDDDVKVRISYEHEGYVWLGYKDAERAKLFKDERLLLKDVHTYMDKKEEMEKLNVDYKAMPSRHRSWRLSGRFVKGEGPVNAKVVVVGQAPGAFEDAEGRPFVGRSGVLLNHLLELAGLRRDKVYITSVVQFFPPKNRLPSASEVNACRSYLIRQIGIIKPRLVITLGNLSASVLLDGGRVMKSHGSVVRKDGIMYFITLHPAAAVRIKRNMPIIEDDFRKLKVLVRELHVA